MTLRAKRRQRRSFKQANVPKAEGGCRPMLAFAVSGCKFERYHILLFSPPILYLNFLGFLGALLSLAHGCALLFIRKWDIIYNTHVQL
jgi:hypothetical protein